MATPEGRPNQLIVAWSVLGFAALLGHALYKLAPIAWVPIDEGMTQLQMGALIVWVAWMWYTEGYKAFQKQLCPRFIKRATWLGRDRRLWLVALAPMFCMGMFHATRKRLIISWAITIGVIGLVIGVRYLHQPWRGIVDAGVVVGLGWGLGWLLYYWGRAMVGSEPAVSPELPEGDR